MHLNTAEGPFLFNPMHNLGAKLRKTVPIRPEQARELLALYAAKSAADKCWAAGVRVLLAGLAEGATIESIDDAGTVTLTVPDAKENQGG